MCVVRRALGTDEGSQRNSSCRQCQSGSFQPEFSAIACIPCAPGTYVAAKGRTACLACAAGGYCEDVGASSAAACQQRPRSRSALRRNAPSQECLMPPFISPLLSLRQVPRSLSCASREHGRISWVSTPAKVVCRAAPASTSQSMVPAAQTRACLALPAR